MINKYRCGERDFIRRRKLPMDVTSSIILSLPKKSLNTELLEFVTNMDSGTLPRVSDTISAAAFCKQRAKIKPSLFSDMLVEMGKVMLCDQNNPCLWHGRRIVSFDGTGVQVPLTPNTRNYFGVRNLGHDREKEMPTPMAEIMVDVLNDIILCARLDKTGTTEIDLALSMFDSIPENGIALFDRYYPSYYFIYSLNSRNVDFVMKCKKNFNPEVSAFYKSGKDEGVVTIKCTSKAIKKLNAEGVDCSTLSDFTLRIVRNRNPNGEDSLILTSLSEADGYNRQEILQLYPLRWTIETVIGQAKEEEQLDISSGIRPICIKQDFFATCIVYNIEIALEMADNSLVMRANTAGRHKNSQKINKNLVWALLKIMLPKFLSRDSIDIEAIEKILQLIGHHLIPIRPGRHVKRIFRYGGRGRYRPDINYKRAI